MEENRFEVGDFVLYYNHVGAKPELGRVKSIAPRMSHEQHTSYFVVYHCAGDWKNYRDYTGARTAEWDLRPTELENINVKIEEI